MIEGPSMKREIMDQEVMNRLRKFGDQRKQELIYLKELNLNALKQKSLKKLTILHSNDLHGDFLAAEVDSELVGGVSMLSGYIHKVKNEEENVIYAIAGDMLRGSIIDSEYKGLSTIGVMNLLEPDVATIGNHEVDYGFSHLLFIEKCAEFPIINANMYLNVNGTRLFDSHIVLDVGGMKILFIGVLTEEVLASTKQEDLIGKLKKQTDEKYGRVITRLPGVYTHPCRNRETELGDLLAEGLREQLHTDLALIGSGNIRGFTLGPIVTLQDFVEAFPYENSVIGVHMTGAQLRQAMQHLMRDDAIAENTQCDTFQYSKGFFCEYDSGSHTILQLKMNGKDVQDDDVYLVAMERYYYNCMEQALGIKPEEVEKNGPAVQLAGETANVLEEYLMSHDFPKKDTEPRLVIHA